MLLFLAIIPMMSIPAFAEEPVFLTDKSKYYSDELVTIIGSSSDRNKEIEYWLINSGDPRSASANEGISYTDSNGDFAFTNSPWDPLETGYYEAQIEIDDYWLHSRYFNYYAESESPLIVQTDKSEYYGAEDIFITGFTNQTDTTQITLDCYYPNGTQMIPTYHTDIESDGTFDFMLHTTNSTWSNYSGYVIVNATTPDYWNSYVFHYTFETDTTNETLLEFIQKLEMRIFELEYKLENID